MICKIRQEKRQKNKIHFIKVLKVNLNFVMSIYKSYFVYYLFKEVNFVKYVSIFIAEIYS